MLCNSIDVPISHPKAANHGFQILQIFHNLTKLFCYISLITLSMNHFRTTLYRKIIQRTGIFSALNFYLHFMLRLQRRKIFSFS